MNQQMRTYFLSIGLILHVACATTQGTQSGTQQTARASRQNHSETLFETAKILAQHGQFLRAEHYYGAALAEGYPKDKVIPALVAVSISASHYKAALKYALPYLRSRPDQWRLRQLVALIQIATEDYKEAQENLRRVVQDAPNSALGHFVLATLLQDHFQAHTESLPHFQRYLELEPTGMHAAEARNAIATLSEGQGATEEEPG